MSLVTPCTSTVAWPWYRTAMLSRALGLTGTTSEIVLSNARPNRPRWRHRDVGWRRKSCAEATLKQSNEEKYG